VRYHAAEDVTPRLQRVLDALEFSPAYVKTSTWDIVGWNRAASVVMTDYGAIAAGQRNILRMMFSTPHIRAVQTNWKASRASRWPHSAPTPHAPGRPKVFRPWWTSCAG